MARPTRPLHAWAAAATRPQKRRWRPGGGHLLEHEMAGQHRHRRITCQTAHHTRRGQYRDGHPPAGDALGPGHGG
eukprot:413935-Lingulodinium_polyedra.AAC.1